MLSKFTVAVLVAAGAAVVGARSSRAAEGAASAVPAVSRGDAAVPRSATKPVAGSQPTQEEFEAQLRIQIYLDEARYGPGVVDGRHGEFTRKAVAAWNVAHGVEDVDDLTRVTAAAARKVTTLYAAYAMKAGDFKFVTPGLPTKPEEQAKVKYLGYRSAAEFVAERFHTTEAVLATGGAEIAGG